MKLGDIVMLCAAAAIMMIALIFGSCGCTTVRPSVERTVDLTGSGGGSDETGGGGGAAQSTTSATSTGSGGSAGAGGNAPLTAACASYENGEMAECVEAYAGTCETLGWSVVPECPALAKLGCCVISPEVTYCYYFPAYDYTEAYDLCSGFGTWEGL